MMMIPGGLCAKKLFVDMLPIRTLATIPIQWIHTSPQCAHEGTKVETKSKGLGKSKHEVK